MKFQEIPRKITKEVVNEPNLTTPIAFGVSNLGYSLGLTPKMKSVKCLYLVGMVLEKHIRNNISGETIVALEIEYNYAFNADKNETPTTKEIFALMNKSSYDFAIYWDNLLSNTRFAQHGRSEKFQLKNEESDIEKAIDFWEDSLRNRTLDENLKWDDKGCE
jgi:hypothetical protein